jgi:hypothetical protein
MTLLLVVNLLSANDINLSTMKDSLCAMIKPVLNNSYSYYLRDSEINTLNNKITQSLLESGFQVKSNKNSSDKTVEFDVRERQISKDRRSYIFSRTDNFTEFELSLRIIDSKTSSIEFTDSKIYSLKQEGSDDNVSIWKPFIMTLITGSLIYSLWAIE